SSPRVGHHIVPPATPQIDQRCARCRLAKDPGGKLRGGVQQRPPSRRQIVVVPLRPVSLSPTKPSSETSSRVQRGLKLERRVGSAPGGSVSRGQPCVGI